LIGLGRRRKDWIQETSIQPLTSASDHHRHGHDAIKADGHNRLSPERPKAPEIPSTAKDCKALLILMFSALAEAYLRLENQ
jgi:hypothetical protein